MIIYGELVPELWLQAQVHNYLLPIAEQLECFWCWLRVVLVCLHFKLLHH